MSKVRIDTNAFTYPMPDNGYWRVGQQVGKAWSAGKGVKG